MLAPFTAPPTPGRQLPKHVLLAEDEVTIAVTLADDLETKGYRVTWIDDGAAAIDVLRFADVDCVISDLRLPTADGLAVLRFQRSHQPRARAILISAYATLENMRECVHLGATFVGKPFRNERIMDLVARGDPDPAPFDMQRAREAPRDVRQ
jgi:DNA-binding NtrC family response regulator